MALGAEGPSAANVARPNGYALETGDAACDGWGWPKGGIEERFAIARLEARLSFGNAEKECPAGGAGRVGGSPEAPTCRPATWRARGIRERPVGGVLLSRRT